MKNEHSKATADMSAAVKIAIGINANGISPESAHALLTVAASVPHHAIPKQLVTDLPSGNTGPSHNWD